MEVCLSHMTALHWLLRNFNPRESGERPNRVRALPASAPDAALANEIRTYIGSSLPERVRRNETGFQRVAEGGSGAGGETIEEGPELLEVIVSRREGRRSSCGVISHLCTSDNLPAGSFISLKMRACDIWVTSPELTFLHLSVPLDVVGAAYVGMALCSRYRIDELDVSGVVLRDAWDSPLTSVKRINSYLSRASGVRGVERARRALAYVRDGALSPPEGGIALAAELPPLLGGYSLGKVSLNQAIRAYSGVDERGRPQYVTRYPDVVIRSIDGRGRARMAGIDYDPLVTHGGEMHRQFDLERGNQITAARRLDHFTFTGQQNGSYRSFADSMDQVRRALGQRRFPREQEGEMAHRVDLARRDLWERCLHGGIVL